MDDVQALRIHLINLLVPHFPKEPSVVTDIASQLENYILKGDVNV